MTVKCFCATSLMHPSAFHVVLACRLFFSQARYMYPLPRQPRQSHDSTNQSAILLYFCLWAYNLLRLHSRSQLPPTQLTTLINNKISSLPKCSASLSSLPRPLARFRSSKHCFDGHGKTYLARTDGVSPASPTR